MTWTRVVRASALPARIATLALCLALSLLALGVARPAHAQETTPAATSVTVESTSATTAIDDQASVTNDEGTPQPTPIANQSLAATVAPPASPTSPPNPQQAETFGPLGWYFLIIAVIGLLIIVAIWVITYQSEKNWHATAKIVVDSGMTPGADPIAAAGRDQEIAFGTAEAAAPPTIEGPLTLTLRQNPQSYTLFAGDPQVAAAAKWSAEPANAVQIMPDTGREVFVFPLKAGTVILKALRADGTQIDSKTLSVKKASVIERVTEGVVKIPILGKRYAAAMTVVFGLVITAGLALSGKISGEGTIGLISTLVTVTFGVYSANRTNGDNGESAG